MRPLPAPGVAAVLSLLVLATTAHAGVGFQHFTVPDPAAPKGGQQIEVGVWYPTDARPAPERLELGEQTVADNAPVRGGHLPLVVISHGHGGSYAGHYDTAIALANAGFVAAALTHSGDNYKDESRATEIWERPRQLKVLTDYMVDRWPEHARIDPGRIGAFGFSAGGFTVLAEAGGDADLSKIEGHCKAHPTFDSCRDIASHPINIHAKVAWTHDPRIKAVVSAAPAIGFTFGRIGLSGVHQPVQLWRAGDDHVLPYPYYAEAVRLALPTAPKSHVVPHAGHYDFLAPCSPQLAQAVPEICRSEPGFDRAGFHVVFNRDVVAFFERTLGASRTS